MKRFGLLICLMGGLMLSGGCSEPRTIDIGFSAQLTGRQAELGVQERNGVMLAVDEINEAGGIGGRKVNLIVKDDFGTPEGAVSADTELAQKKVVCIIGHATSAQTLAGLPVAQKNGIIMMSPTTSTAELSGEDDNFFRIIQSLVDRGRGLAEYVYKEKRQTKLAVIYDTVNKAYVDSFWRVFSEKYRELGGVVVAEDTFSSSNANTDFESIVKKQSGSGAQALLIIAADTDTALIAQHARIVGWDVPLYSSAWAQTDILVKNGGKAVEGMVLEQSFPLGSTAEKYVSFKERFKSVYGKDPAFAAAFGYETMQVLAQALAETKGESQGLKEALLEIRNYQGLVDTLSIDPNGDVIRPYYLGEVKNAAFVDLENYSGIQ